MLCKEFGWTHRDIVEMPAEFYSDAFLVLAKIRAKEKQLNKQKKPKGTRKRR